MRDAPDHPGPFIAVGHDECLHVYLQSVKLRIGLDRASRMYRDAVDGKAGRAAAKFALGAVVEFIRALPDDGFDLPLARLFIALDALDNGLVQPMLKPDPPGRGGQRDKIRDHFFAYVVALADRMPRPELARRLAAVGYSSITAETIRQWQRDLKKLGRADYRRRRCEAVRLELDSASSERLDNLIANLATRFPPSLAN